MIIKQYDHCLPGLFRILLRAGPQLRGVLVSVTSPAYSRVQYSTVQYSLKYSKLEPRNFPSSESELEKILNSSEFRFGTEVVFRVVNCFRKLETLDNSHGLCLINITV